MAHKKGHPPDLISVSKRLFILKSTLFFVMVIVVVGLGSSSFIVFTQLETKSFNEVFKSSAGQLAKTVGDRLKSKIAASAVVSNTFSHIIEEGFYGTYPKTYLPGFVDIFSPLLNITSSTLITFNPIITNQTRKEWEAYATSMYNNFDIKKKFDDTLDPNNWKISNGIYCRDINNKDYPCPEITSGKNSKYNDILAPYWQLTPFSKSTHTALLFNAHSEEKRREVIDYVIENKRTSFTDVLQLAIDSQFRPSSILYSHVSSLSKNQTVLGLSSIVFYWDDLFKNILPDHIESVYCIIQTKSNSFTFLIKGGDVKMLGKGEIYDSKYNKYGKDITHIIPELDLSLSDFKVVMYPGKDLYDKYHTTMPLMICLVEVAVAVFTALLIYLYLWFANKKEQLLKQMVVGYFSHELRTPLNTVNMGVTLLQKQFTQHPFREDKLHYIDIINEINISCEILVDILNNVIVYESLQAKLLDMNIESTSVKSLMDRSVSPFAITAKHRNIGFDVEVQVEDPAEYEQLEVLVDEPKFHLILRNLISNSFNNVDEEGRVAVTIRYTDQRTSNSEKHNETRKIKNNNSNSAVREAVIEFKDSGIPIPEGDVSRIFEDNNFRFQAGVIRNGHSIGLNILVASKLLKLFNGKITYERGDCAGKEEGVGKDPNHPWGNIYRIRIPLKSDPIGNVTTNLTHTNLHINDHDNNNNNNDNHHQSNDNNHHNDNDWNHINNNHSNVSNNIDINGLSSKYEMEFRHNNSNNYNNKDHENTQAVPLPRAEQNQGDNHRVDLAAYRGQRTSSYAKISPTPHEQPIRESIDRVIVESDQTHFDNMSSSNSSNTRYHSHISHSHNHMMMVNNSGTSFLFNYRILVVDDVAMNRKMLCRHLEGHCPSIDTAEDGQVAVNKLDHSLASDSPYDVVLMDYQMPNMDGPTAAQLMRDHGFKGRIIGITGNVLPVHIDTFLSHGANHVLPKPLDFDALIQILRGEVKYLT